MARIEAILFVAREPLTSRKIAQRGTCRMERSAYGNTPIEQII